MHFAIIAAGEGQRLKEEGFSCPKPLLEINGVPLIKRLLDSCIRNGATTISCIINEESPALYRYLIELELPVPLNILIKSTPSSMHSLFALRVFLKNIPFVLLTTDTIYKEIEFGAFLHECQHTQGNGVIAVTDFVDDEKPLYVEFDSAGIINKFADSKQTRIFVTGGIYYFRDDIFRTAEMLLNSGRERLRNLLKHLAENGYRMKAFSFSKMIDVDHVTDIEKAAELLGEETL
jgi:NDP-sugar pyrophosphorylase family protein